MVAVACRRPDVTATKQTIAMQRSRFFWVPYRFHRFIVAFFSFSVLSKIKRHRDGIGKNHPAFRLSDFGFSCSICCWSFSSFFRGDDLRDIHFNGLVQRCKLFLRTWGLYGRDGVFTVGHDFDSFWDHDIGHADHVIKSFQG